MKKIYSIIAIAAAICAFIPFAKAQNAATKDAAKGGTGAGWQERDGLAYNKSISEPTTEGIYTITLESFTTGKVTVTHEGIPADIVLVLDYSGSMAYRMGQNNSDGVNDNGTDTRYWSRMKTLREAVKDFIDQIDLNDQYSDPDTQTPWPNGQRLGNQIAIITFAGSGTSSYKAHLTGLAGNGKSSLISAVNGLTSPNGGTWADEGMEKAYDEIRPLADTRRRRTVVFFTDGIPGNGTAWMTTESHGRPSQTVLSTNAYNTWLCANNVIDTANDIKSITNEEKDIKSTVYTVSVVTNPDEYTNVYLGKTSSEWKNATNMADLSRTMTSGGTTYHYPPTWNSTDIWANGNGTRASANGTYAFATTSASELKKIFESIASSSGGSTADLDNTTVSQVDVVSASFSLPAGADNNSIEVYTVRYVGDKADGSHIFDSTTVSGKKVENLVKAPNRTEQYLRKWTDEHDVYHEQMTDVDNAITWSLTASVEGSTKKDKITVNGFDYANLWCGPDESVTSGPYAGWHQGYKIVIKIPVKMDDMAVGGPNLNTNGPGSGIYINGVNQFPFISPQVSLPTNIHIRKEGLEIGESAKFKIMRSSDGGNTWTPATSVFVTRTAADAKEGENAPITKIVGLPATDNSTPAKPYIYQVVEEPWTWSYVSGHTTPDRTDLLITNPFIFTNRKKDNIDVKVKNAESKAFNTFLPGNTEGSYVDSKPRTTTTTTP